VGRVGTVESIGIFFFFLGAGRKKVRGRPPGPTCACFFYALPRRCPRRARATGPARTRDAPPLTASDHRLLHTPCSSPREQAHGDAPRRCGPASGGWNVGVPLHLHFLMHLDQHNIKQHFSPLSVPTRACTTLTPTHPPLTPLPQHAVGRKRKKAVYKEKKGKQTNIRLTGRGARGETARDRARDFPSLPSHLPPPPSHLSPPVDAEDAHPVHGRQLGDQAQDEGERIQGEGLGVKRRGRGGRCVCV
jgi:hypothetical protein